MVRREAIVSRGDDLPHAAPMDKRDGELLMALGARRVPCPDAAALAATLMDRGARSVMANR